LLLYVVYWLGAWYMVTVACHCGRDWRNRRYPAVVSEPF